MIDAMLDLETLGTGPDAPILTIGAMIFDRRTPPPDIHTMMGTSSTFYARIALDARVTVDSDTMTWWMKQEPEARHEAFHTDNRVSLESALCLLVKWCSTHHVRYMWSHGSSFDCVIIAWHLRRIGEDTPWRYWNIRDTRTLYELAGVTMNDLPPAKKHHALYDCYRQVVGVNMAYKRLKL